MFVFASVLELQKQPKTHDSFNHGECSGSDQKTLIRVKRGGGGGWGGLKSGEDRRNKTKKNIGGCVQCVGTVRG